MLARIPTHPIDTCKARLQADSYRYNISSSLSSTSSAVAASTSSQSIVYRNTFQTISSIIRNEGFRGLYRGFSIAFLGSGPAACLYFTSYEVSKRWLLSFTKTTTISSSPKNGTNSNSSTSITTTTTILPSSLIHLCSGILAETCSCVLWVPIDVIKERMQVQGTGTPRNNYLTSSNPGHYRNTYDAFRKIMKYEGIKGVYRGYGATLASFGPFSALYFVFYEALKDRSLKYLYPSSSVVHHDLPLLWQIITAMSAGTIASLLTNPLDLVKLRLQVQRQQLSIASMASISSPSNVSTGINYQYSGMFDGMKEILQKEGGIKGLFRGAGARVAFHAPSTAISMTLFEQCRALVERTLLVS